MQHLDLSPRALAAYHEHIQSDHDFRIRVNVLTLEEKFVTSLDFLDGQVNLPNAEDGPDRTASVILSDPEGALDFGESYLYDPKGMVWVNRLLQIWHEVDVPGVGDEIPTEVRRNHVRYPAPQPVSGQVGSYGTTHVAGSHVRTVGGVTYPTVRSIAGTSTGRRAFTMALSPAIGFDREWITVGVDVWLPSNTAANSSRWSVLGRDGALNNSNAMDTTTLTPANGGTFAETPVDQWHRRVYRFKQKEGFSLSLFYLHFTTSDPTDYFETTRWTIEEGWTDGEYFDGDIPDDSRHYYAWTGTPGASASTRTAFRTEALTVATSCGVYLPTSVSRDSAEVSLEVGDKSLLADHGVRPASYKKGMRVDRALRAILEENTGEKHFRIPRTTKVLSRPYTVGMGEDTLTPWRLFKKVALAEADWIAYYDAEGFATCEPADAVKPSVVVKSMLALPSATASLSEFSNYAKVTSHRKPTNKRGDSKAEKARNARTTLIHDSVVALKNGNQLSEQSLARHGVPRTLPIVEVNDDLKNLQATLKRADNLLTADSGLGSNRAFEIIPIFHLEPHEHVDLPEGVGKRALAPGSIPLGTGGNQTVGSLKWVSRPPKVKKIRSKTTRKVKKKKGGKK